LHVASCVSATSFWLLQASMFSSAQLLAVFACG